MSAAAGTSVSGHKRPRPAELAAVTGGTRGAGSLLDGSAAGGAATGGAGTGSSGGGISETASRLHAFLLKREGGASSAECARALRMSPEELLPALQELLNCMRVQGVKQRRTLPDGSTIDEQLYTAVAEARAAKLAGLSAEELAVLSIIERAGDQGVWVRTLKLQSKLQQQQINKILKRLETRKLAKPVKSIAYKNRRMYMAFDLEPAKELTGGVWYSEQQLDIEFITAIRMFIVRIIREAGGAASPLLVAEQLQQSGVSTVPLSAGDVQQVLDTLLMEGWVDYEDAGRTRVAHLHKPEAMDFPSKKALLAEFSKKGRGGRSAGAASSSSAGDYIGDGDEDDDDDEDDDGEDGDATSLTRRYVLLRKPSSTAVDPLSSVPCGTCPVLKQCTPGGVVSPETCVYFSHWLQW